ncbi:HEAT repeat domain-containing protein [Bremerella sp. P1]|uniref:HEAT repeat domain-containing protein n=1 Tax=Bremerella sp. P1 TaxID=3026424 RepID=UPI002367DA3D|nr:HEAT repeat domain-containing protein [Bremerella sp. P1]WDI42658.1 HEAT repeat domain-containing protein [Bremerella sp. P1]
MDQQSPLCGILVALLLGLTGCASNGAIVDPIIWWDKDDPADLAKYGPTPVQRIEALDDLASSAGGMSAERRAEEAATIAKALPEEQNEVIRVHMLRSLAKLNTPDAFAAIKSSLFDSDADVRRAAVVALGESKNPEAVDALADVLIRDRDYDVRVTAATALGEFKTPKAKEALVPALDARDPAMRFAAIESLRKTSNVDYQGDTAKWREFAMGGNPEPPPYSIADQLVPSFFR